MGDVKPLTSEEEAWVLRHWTTGAAGGAAATIAALRADLVERDATIARLRRELEAWRRADGSDWLDDARLSRIARDLRAANEAADAARQEPQP